MATADATRRSNSGGWSFRRALVELNGRRHRVALGLFMAFMAAHWVEHLVQAFQIWAFDTPRKKALGALGQAWPGLVRTEGLHYFYAVGMMLILLLLAPGFKGAARGWWMAAVVLQAWHFFEHSFLVYQFMTGYRFLGKPVQTSVVQAVIPRVELHLFYNAVVTIPIVVAMILHRRSRERLACTCATPQQRVERHALASA